MKYPNFLKSVAPRMAKKIYCKSKSAYLFNKTVVLFSKKPKISECIQGEIVIRGYHEQDLTEIKKIYQKLNKGVFSNVRAGLYSKVGSSLLFVAADRRFRPERIIGMDMFCLNPRDFKENTVHEGFIGVLPEAEGQGIATKMRKAAISHFEQAGFSGISTRISKNNLGSLRSAEKLGFKVVDAYFDEVMKEDRYYLICNFDGNND